MVLYEFLCENCGLFEQMRDVNDDNAAISCPNCGGKAEHNFSAPTFFRTFSGTQHMLRRRNEKGVEPRVVSRLPKEGPASGAHQQQQSHAHHTHGDRPWMLKH